MSDCNHTWKQTETTGTTCVHCGAKYQRPLEDWERIAELEAELAELSADYHGERLRADSLFDQLAALKEAAQAEVDRQRHQCGILRQELQPTTAALASLLQGEGNE